MEEIQPMEEILQKSVQSFWLQAAIQSCQESGLPFNEKSLEIIAQRGNAILSLASALMNDPDFLDACDLSQ